MGNFADQVLQKMRKSQDVAAWYRLLSKSQINGLIKLPHALRDDRAQGCTYRVRECITALGIEPIIGNGSLKKLITCCQGSDVAFLYFLLIGYYKRPHKSNDYTYSEQVLMSCIMELDLEMTLHALDQILPTGHPTPREHKYELKDPLNKKRDNLMKNKNKSPYFWRQPRPKQCENPYTSIRPDVVVSFPFWPAGESAVYKLDENRWFASYKLQPIRRLTHALITEIINDYSSKYSDEVGPNDSELKLCPTHKAALEQKEIMKDEIIVKAFHHCLELFDVASKENRERRERIVSQLDTDIENYTRFLQKLQRVQYTTVGNLKGCSFCKPDKLITTPVQDDQLKSLHGKDDVRRLNPTATSALYEITGTNRLEKVSERSDAKEIEKVTEKELYTTLLKCCPSHKVLRAASIKRPKSKKLRKRKYFRSSQLHQPYLFDYQRTFQAPGEPTEAIQVLRQEAIRALIDDEDDATSKDSSQLESNRDNVIKAIVRCAESMWSKSLLNYNKNLPSHPRKLSQKTLHYNQTYFNPDDSQLMERMLRDGINLLRGDPKFVLATFPNAHKTIVMREWIKRRYGKTYKHNEVVSSQKIADHIFQTISLLHNREPPTPDIHPFIVGGLTYADQGKMFKLANRLKAKYYCGLNDKLMQYTALCWSAMGGEFHKGDSLKDVFYSYLPARNIDITRVNPWQVDLKRAKKINQKNS